ncbi:MAG TPA: hypothetical protein VIG24_08890 [Acidimicrobiia bacterium]
MPDTGAPWNIPYVESTDLVSDWPADSLALANAIDAGLDAAGNAGIGSNVVQTTKLDTFSTTSTSFTDLTGLSVAITPSSATAKVLVVWSVVVGFSASSRSATIVLTDGSDNVLFGGTPAGSRYAASMSSYADGSGGADRNQAFSGAYLWSPASASAVTAKIRILGVGTGTTYVNRSGSDIDSVFTPRMASSITAIEVAA